MVFGMRVGYTVDLMRIRGTGDFLCPSCRTVISPDDVEEKSYRILFVDFEGEDVAEILIECNTCRSRINIIGFGSLNKYTNSIKLARGQEKSMQIFDDETYSIPSHHL